MVSIILLAEASNPQAIDKIIENLYHQTYSGDIEIILGLVADYQESVLDDVIVKYSNKFVFKFVKANGLDILKQCYDAVEGEFVFYKTIGSEQFLPLWYPRHIEVALSNLTDKEYYGYSMLEYRNLQAINSLSQAMWWRIENFVKEQPKANLLVIDEVWHRVDKNRPIEYERLVEDNRINIQKINSIFKDKKMKFPKEITVLIYTLPEILNSLIANNQINAAPTPQNSNQIEIKDNEVLL